MDLIRERRFTLTWLHALAFAAILPLTVQSLTASWGLADRSLLLLGRIAAPLLVVVLTPGLALRDAAVGSAELVGTTRAGLGRVWLARLLITLLWCSAALLLFMIPVEMRTATRHPAWAEIVASVSDLLLYAAVAGLVGHRTGSAIAGQIAGVILWSAGMLIGIRPPEALPELGYLTPLSPYFFGPVSYLLANRVLWTALAILGIAWEVRTLTRSALPVRKE